MDTAFFLARIFEIESSIGPDGDWTVLSKVIDLRNHLLESERHKAQARKQQIGAKYCATLSSYVKFGDTTKPDSFLNIS